ncbi:SMI1/KNR4 family protein [Nocardia sp. NPDC052316]|uniref:SMI1/KNR4 family protein n=1 Tax=Nocardia sp. NPDC052316 TaxID=3364329 RepID=UPI0037C6537A
MTSIECPGSEARGACFASLARVCPLEQGETVSPRNIDWTRMLAEMAAINRFAKQQSDYVDATIPYPGADDSAVNAAEQRLGLHLDPEYREFLGHADGWPRWDGHQSLLGTREMVTDTVIFNGSQAPWSTIFEGLPATGGKSCGNTPDPPSQPVGRGPFSTPATACGLRRSTQHFFECF